MGKLDNQIALITGASRGIGFALAKELAAEGAHVIAVARTVGALEELDDEIKKAGGEATLVPLDLREHDLIDQLGGTIYERWGKLDILVGNAGMLGNLTPVAHADPKMWKQVMDINVNANYRLIRSMDPLLKHAGGARALFVTSGAAQGNFPYWGPYGVSKAALEAMVHTYAAENDLVKVNLFDPGIVHTRMRAQAFPGEDKSKLAEPEDVVAQMMPLLMPDCDISGDIVRAA